MTYAPQPTSGEAMPDEASRSRRGWGCLLEIVETLVLTLVIYLLIHNFVAQPFEVEQMSMSPTIAPGEYVLIDKITPRFDPYSRGDVVVFTPPPGYEQQGDIPFIKRIIALPGETIRLENGRVFITPVGGVPTLLDESSYLRSRVDGGPVETLPSGQGTTEWTVPEDSYFVMGDNRGSSQDSRVFGPIGEDLILGRAWLRYFPLDRVGFMSAPEYPNLRAGDEAGYLGGSSATIQVSISRP
ncbi:MAG TPA: signal peptidase I [candidate division Zixibacteria bacterium]|nr:signal peptidase I [candidate division Zixibacteria bacterium]